MAKKKFLETIWRFPYNRGKAKRNIGGTTYYSNKRRAKKGK